MSAGAVEPWAKLCCWLVCMMPVPWLSVVQHQEKPRQHLSGMQCSTGVVSK